MKITETKAYKMLSQAKSLEERAEVYAERIQKTLSIKLIDGRQEEIEKVDDRIFELSQLASKGAEKLTKGQCESVLEELINLEVEKTLMELDLKAYKTAFKAYFGEV